MNKILSRVVPFVLCLLSSVLYAQVPPSASEIAEYTGLHKAAHTGDVEALQSLIDAGVDLEARDRSDRTAAHIAAFAARVKVIELLAEAGANLDALEQHAYDIVTISAVDNNLDFLSKALELGASARNITSPYDGTALIAAAHLGHHEAINLLVKYDAPLDHINNLNWTALIEVVVLGDGGTDHLQSAELLLAAGADQTIGDGRGITPLEHAKLHGFNEMVELFESYQK